MFKTGSKFNVIFNVFLSVVWLVSISILISRGDFSLVFGAATVSFICFTSAAIINFKIYKNNKCCIGK